jgi:hypothetical protein
MHCLLDSSERYPLHKPPKHRISTASKLNGDDEVD